MSRQNTPRSGKTPNTNPRFTVNTLDGLSPANDRLDNLLLTGPPPPKVADLIDLQRLYDVMRKHGQSFANLPFSLNSPLGDYTQAGLLSNKERDQLKKQAFYHYPYPYQNAKSIKNMGMPLYVVTGAKALGTTHLKTQKLQQKPAESIKKPFSHPEHAKMYYNHTPRNIRSKNDIAITMPYVSSPIKKTVVVQKGSEGEQYEGIRSVTVSMMKNPQALERITEH